MELRKSEENFKRLAQREQILQDRLAAQALHVLEKSGKFENINVTELRPSQIVTMFQELYSQGEFDVIALIINTSVDKRFMGLMMVSNVRKQRAAEASTMISLTLKHG